MAEPGQSNATVLRSINPILEGANVFTYKLNEYAAEADQAGRLLAAWAPHADPYDSHDANLFLSFFQWQLACKLSADGLSAVDELRGKIMVLEYERNIPDGAAAVESLGFMDEHDFPPIDTWFYRAAYGADWLLFAWIPQQYVHLVDEAIAVQFLGIVHWFKDWRPAEYESLMYSS